jgi:branched-chain amino acid transport system substrate-binding protein
MQQIFVKRIGIGFICLVLTLALFHAFSLEARAADTIKIGQLEPFTGPFESNARTWNAGLKFAVDEQNAKGGLLGKKIEILTEDDEAKPDVATRKAKKLVLENKVDFITSGLGSHVAIALNNFATANKALYINYASFSDEITGKEFSRYAFRVCTNNYGLTSGMAYLISKTKYRKFYFIHPDYAAGRDNDRVYKQLLSSQIPGSTFVGTDFFPLGATRDFGPYITKIIASKADGVVFTGYGPDCINFVKQARAMGLKSDFPIFAALILHPYLLKELKDDAIGMYWVGAYSMRVKTPANQEMVKKFHELHKNDKDFLTWWPFPDLSYALLGWKMTFAAVEKAGSVEPEKVIEAFENDFQWQSPVGLWKMRKCDHQAIMPIFGGMIAGGPNPYYSGHSNPEYNFPWSSEDVIELPADKVAIPATPEYNPRCK